MEFKVNDKVKVVRKNTWAYGLTGVITGIKTISSGKFWGYYVTFNDSTNNKHGNSIFWEDDELALETMTLKEAQKACIDGAKVCVVGSMYPKSHLYFDNGKFMYYSEMTGVASDDIGSHAYQWKLWTEPPIPPLFTVNSLVHNTDGTIGKIIEEKGIIKGERWYSVKFNAVKDTVKQCKESELSAYE